MGLALTGAKPQELTLLLLLEPGVHRVLTCEGVGYPLLAVRSLVSWRFEPCKALRMIPGLKTNFSPSGNYSVHNLLAEESLKAAIPFPVF